MNYSYLKYDTKLLLWQAFAFITILNSQRFTVISDNKTSLIPITKVKSWMGIVLRYWYLRYKGGDDANCRNKVTFLSNKGRHAELTVPAYPSCLNSSNKLLLLLKSQSLILGSSEINIGKHVQGIWNLTWALLSSSMISFFSLLISQTHMNSTSLFPLKNSFLIFWTTADADLPRGTGQFSISQNTPIGSGSGAVDPWLGDPVNEFLNAKAVKKDMLVITTKKNPFGILEY